MFHTRLEHYLSEIFYQLNLLDVKYRSDIIAVVYFTAESAETAEIIKLATKRHKKHRKYILLSFELFCGKKYAIRYTQYARREYGGVKCQYRPRGNSEASSADR